MKVVTAITIQEFDRDMPAQLAVSHLKESARYNLDPTDQVEQNKVEQYRLEPFYFGKQDEGMERPMYWKFGLCNAALDIFDMTNEAITAMKRELLSLRSEIEVEKNRNFPIVQHNLEMLEILQNVEKASFWKRFEWLLLGVKL